MIKMGIVRIVIHYSIIFAFQSKVKLFCARLKKKTKKLRILRLFMERQELFLDKKLWNR